MPLLMMPHLFGVSGGGGGTNPSIRDFAVAGGTTLNNQLNIARPPGTVDGDLFIACVASNDGLAVSTKPTQFTALPGSGQFSGEMRAYLYLGIADDATDPATFQWLWSNNNSRKLGIIVAIQDFDVGSPVADSGGANSGNGAPIPEPIAPSVAAGAANSLLLCFAQLHGLSDPTPVAVPTGMNAEGEHTAGAVGSSDDSQVLSWASEIVGAGATGTRAFARNAGTAQSCSFSVAVNPG